MATTTVQLSVDGKTYNKTKTYTKKITKEVEADSSDNFIDLLLTQDGLTDNTIQSLSCFYITNLSDVGAEIQYKFQDWKDSTSNTDINNSVDVSGAGASNDRYITRLLPAGDMIYENSGRMCGYFRDASAANAATLNNQVPDANMYTVVDSSGANEAIDDSETEIDVDDMAFYRRGDLIRIDDEIMEITALSTSDGNGTLTVIRGAYGSTKAAHDITDDIRLPFFNAYNVYNKYSVVQTNKDGRFKAMNFFGYGRQENALINGIVPSSVAIKFYEQAYQEFGLSGITANTNTGLSASTVYYFNIAIDGGSAYEVAFTTDATNTNFGGKNGILSKIQSIFDQQYYTEGNLYEKRVTIGIVNGDIRITSGSRLATSAVAITAGTSGGSNTTNLFDGSNPIARIPATVESAVASKLSDDTLFSKNNIESPNSSVFMHDDGHGNLLGVGTGTINYATGEIDFVSYPNAQFVVSANYSSAHSGATNNTANGINQLQSIGVRSCNPKLNTNVLIEAFGE